MNDSMNDHLDPILLALWDARDQLTNNFENIKMTFGDTAYAMAMEKLQEEHDELRAQIDNRINRRIMQLAQDDRTE